MRGLIGDLCIKTYLVNQNPAETCQVFGKNFSGQLYMPRLRKFSAEHPKIQMTASHMFKDFFENK
jgi:hypothetical protein